MLLIDMSGSSFFGTVESIEERDHDRNLRGAGLFGNQQQRQGRRGHFFRAA
jgi:hypothetical protein